MPPPPKPPWRRALVLAVGVALIVGMLLMFAAGPWFVATHRHGRSATGFEPGWTCEWIAKEHQICSRMPPVGKHAAP